jgi:hypothetical protein
MRVPVYTKFSVKQITNVKTPIITINIQNGNYIYLFTANILVSSISSLCKRFIANTTILSFYLQHSTRLQDTLNYIITFYK